jgi:hypothetical protein
VLRLVGLLADAGYADVVVPRCVDCGVIDRSCRPLGTPVEDGRVCRRCARRRAEPCGRCGRVALAYRRASDGPICEWCWRADPDATSMCSL